MDPDLLIKQIKDAYQEAADLLNIDFELATEEEKDLIIEISTVKQHHTEWFMNIGAWGGLQTNNRSAHFWNT